MKKVFSQLDKCTGHLTTETLGEMGIIRPTKKQIKIIELFTQRILFSVAHHLAFNKKLSQKEISCLFWAANGKTTYEMAKLLNVEISTIKTHRKRIQQKLKCKNITQAVFEGIRLGYLQPKIPFRMNPSFEGQTSI